MNVPDTHKISILNYAYSVKYLHSVLSDFHMVMVVTLFREVCCNFV